MRKPENIFLFLGTIFIGTLIFLMPLNRVPDEGTHASNAWALFHETETNESYDWTKSFKQDANIDTDEYRDKFIKKIDLSHEKVQIHMSRNYILYFPQIIGMWIGSIIYPSAGVIMMVGRLLNALFYLLAMFFIIKYAKFGQYALSFISLLPISIQQAASLSYDVVNFVSISFFYMLTSNLILNKVLNKKKIIFLCLSIITLYFTKLNNLSLIILLPFLQVMLPEKYSALNNRLSKTYSWIKNHIIAIAFSAFFVSFALAILIFKNMGGITHFLQIIINSIFNSNLNQALNPVVSAGIFGFVGLFNIQFPLWLLFIDVSVLTLLMLSGFEQKNSKWPFNFSYSLISAALFPLQVIMVMGGMYFSWTQVVLGEGAVISSGSQGRYFTPFLIYFAPLFITYNHSIKGVFNQKLLRNLLIVTLVVNFLITIYLIFMAFWLVDYQENWLLIIRRMIN